MLARSEALHKRAPEPYPRRALGAPSYAREGGAPRLGADPDATPLEAPASLWLGPGETFFFLGVASGSLPFLRSGSSIDAAWKARSMEHTTSLSVQGTVMILPLPGILRTL